MYPHPPSINLMNSTTYSCLLKLKSKSNNTAPEQTWECFCRCIHKQEDHVTLSVQVELGGVLGSSPDLEAAGGVPSTPISALRSLMLCSSSLILPPMSSSELTNQSQGDHVLYVKETDRNQCHKHTNLLKIQWFEFPQVPNFYQFTDIYNAWRTISNVYIRAA